MNKHGYGKYRLLLVLIMLGAAVLFVACASVSIESVRDPRFSGKVVRLFVFIRDNGHLKRPYSENLQKAMTERLSARGIASHVQIISPLDLDETKYGEDVKAFSPDAVLVVQTTGGTRRLQEVIEVYWDASLRSTETKTRIWRANIHMSGGSSPSRMTALTDAILTKMEQDGIIAPFVKAEKKQESAPPAGSDVPEGGEAK